MKKNIIKKEIVDIGTMYAGITLKKSTYQDYNFELSVKCGTSNTTYYFYDLAVASERFDEEVKKMKEV